MSGEAGPFCIAVEESSDALCQKEPGHDGPHTGWAHYPGQMVTWLNTAALAPRPSAHTPQEGEQP